jgi:hypothetical protein
MIETAQFGWPCTSISGNEWRKCQREREVRPVPGSSIPGSPGIQRSQRDFERSGSDGSGCFGKGPSAGLVAVPSLSGRVRDGLDIIWMSPGQDSVHGFQDWQRAMWNRGTSETGCGAWTLIWSVLRLVLSMFGFSGDQLGRRFCVCPNSDVMGSDVEGPSEGSVAVTLSKSILRVGRVATRMAFDLGDHAARRRTAPSAGVWLRDPLPNSESLGRCAQSRGRPAFDEFSRHLWGQGTSSGLRHGGQS